MKDPSINQSTNAHLHGDVEIRARVTGVAPGHDAITLKFGESLTLFFDDDIQIERTIAALRDLLSEMTTRSES